MLCHVTRPDSVVMEVEVDAKANGEDCLNKVGCLDTNMVKWTSTEVVYWLINGFKLVFLKKLQDAYFPKLRVDALVGPTWLILP